jgi:hypothetical protein
MRPQTFVMPVLTANKENVIDLTAKGEYVAAKSTNTTSMPRGCFRS